MRGGGGNLTCAEKFIHLMCMSKNRTLLLLSSPLRWIFLCAQDTNSGVEPNSYSTKWARYELLYDDDLGYNSNIAPRRRIKKK